MTPPLTTRAIGDLIRIVDHNDIGSYIELGTYRVNTKALEIAGNEVIDLNENIITAGSIYATGSMFMTSGSLIATNEFVTDMLVDYIPQGQLPSGSMADLSDTYIPHGVLAIGSIPSLVSLYIEQGVLPIGSIPSLSTLYMDEGADLDSGSLVGTISSGIIPDLSDTYIPQGELSAGSIPDLSATYLSLSGGTLTGNLIGTNISITGSILSTGSIFMTSGSLVATKEYVDSQAGGAGSVSLYQASVGASGANYTTLGSALDAGLTRLIVVDNTTETANIALPNECMIEGTGMNNVTVDMATYVFTSDSTDDYTFRDMKIIGSLSDGHLFPTVNQIRLQDIYIDLSSATASYPIISSANSTLNELFFNNLYLKLPNQAQCGMLIYYAYLNNIFFYTGGTSSTYGIYADNSVIDGVRLFTNTSTSTPFIELGNSTLNNMVTTNSCLVSGNNYGKISNCNISAGNLVLGTAYNSVTNCRFVGITGGITGNNNMVTNCHFTGALTISGNNNTLENCQIAALTLTGDGNLVSNTSSTGTLTVSEGGIHNRFMNYNSDGDVSITGDNTSMGLCRAGVLAGGGAVTITINAAASNTILNGCHTDADIVDSSSDDSSVILGCITY